MMACFSVAFPMWNTVNVYVRCEMASRSFGTPRASISDLGIDFVKIKSSPLSMSCWSSRGRAGTSKSFLRMLHPAESVASKRVTSTKTESLTRKPLIKETLTFSSLTYFW